MADRILVGFCYWDQGFTIFISSGRECLQSDAPITMPYLPYDELQVCKVFILAFSELNSSMCLKSVSEGSSQGYSRLLAFQMTYCIEFSELTRHALRVHVTGGSERENKCSARRGYAVCRANDLQHYAAWEQHDTSRAEQQIFISLMLIKQIEVYEGLSLYINKLLDLIWFVKSFFEITFRHFREE